MTTFAELAVQIAEKEAAKKVREQGWNTGPRVQAYQAADGLKLNPDTGYPWCASFLAWCFEQAGRPLLELGESASVGFLLKGAREHDWVVSSPRRGDAVCFFWGSDDWPDHMGLVRRLDGPLLLTVEGNTSSDDRGSQDEGDGVYLKTRDPRTTRMTYFRVPGSPDPVAGFWQWLTWSLGEGEYRKHGRNNKAVRPTGLPPRIPAEWWERRKQFLARRARER